MASIIQGVLAKKPEVAKDGDGKSAPRQPKEPLTPFDIIRIVTGVFTFSFTCLFVAFFAVFFQPMTIPLKKKFGLNPRNSPVSWVCDFGSRFFLGSIGIFWKCTSDKSGNLPNAIYMYNHTSNIDVLCINGCVGYSSQLYKKALEAFFPLKWMLQSLGCISIVRENHQSAITTMNEAMTKRLADGYSVCLSPEGTRSMSGELQPFKKGGFHLAVNTKVPVVPIILSGGYEIWPPTRMFAGVGNLELELLEPIYPKEGQTVDEFLQVVEAAFKANPARKVATTTFLNSAVPVAFTAVGCCAAYWFICTACAAASWVFGFFL